VESGYVPNGAPWQPGCGGGVAWGAAMSIMPWEFYMQYADTDMMRTNYEGMKGYIRYMLTWIDSTGIMHSQATGTNGKPNRWMNLGDWSQPDKLPPDEMVHTFYLWRCADLTAKSSKVLGKEEDFDKYSMLAERTKKAFQSRFYNTEKGTYGPFGGNIFALKMGVPDNQKAKVVASLKADIIAKGGHLDTGIFGTQFFFEVLSENGLHELAYEAMNKRTAPGYGWWIEQGATTSWEGWKDPGSGNHPMFGGGIVWFYRKLAGMNADPEHPGYRNIIFCPEPVSEISSASYSNMTPYGRASIAWEKDNEMMRVNIEVPVGSTATVRISAEDPQKIMESGKVISSRSLIKLKGFKDGYAVFSVGSGNYNFQSVVNRATEDKR
jgi:alpha-L-rhamnosidase